MSTWTADPDWDRVDYAGEAVIASGANHEILKLSVFRTTEPTTKGAIVRVVGGGYRHSFLPSVIDSESAQEPQPTLAACLLAGWDIVLLSVPVARTDDAGLQAAEDMSPTDQETFFNDAWVSEIAGGGGLVEQYGPAYSGNGMLIGPTDGDFTLPTGYAKAGDGSPPHPMQDPARLNAHQGITMATQFLRRNRSALGWSGKPIGIFGGSMSGLCAGWVALGPDRGPYHFPGARGAGSPQDSTSTRGFYSFALMLGWQTLVTAFPDELFWPSNVKSQPAGGDAYYITQAEDGADVLAGSRESISALIYAAAADVLPGNRQFPIHYCAGTPSAFQTAPFDATNTQQMASAHDAWFGFALRKLLGSRMKLLLTGGNETFEAAAQAAGIPYESVDSAHWLAARMSWLESTYQRLVQPQPYGLVELTDADFLPAGEGPDGSDYTPVIPLTECGLTRLTVKNLTNVRIAGSHDNELDHWYIDPGRERTWKRPRHLPLYGRVLGTITNGGAVLVDWRAC